MPQAATRSRQELSDVLKKIDDYNLELFRALLNDAPTPEQPELPEWAAWDDETPPPDEGFQYLSTNGGGASYRNLPGEVKEIFEKDRNVATATNKNSQQKTQQVVEEAKKEHSSREERRKRLMAIDQENLDTLSKQQEKSREELLDKLDKLNDNELDTHVAQARRQEGGFFATLLAEVSRFLKNLVDTVIQEVKKFFERIGAKIVNFFKDLFGL